MERKPDFHKQFRDDLTWWVKNDARTALRILRLVEAIVKDPLTGIGKPERVKYLGPDIWSRRITQEHRLIYRVRENRVDFLQARYHY